VAAANDLGCEHDLMDPHVAAVHRSASHSVSKLTVACIRLVADLGVAGDAHAGVTVQHRSRVARDPTRPNLRQVHLVHGELYDELIGRGFAVAPGAMGENITARGIDLLALPTGARLHLGAYAVVEITGLRNPCAQLDDVHAGLMAAVLDRDADGHVVRKAGVMGVVLGGGTVRAGDAIVVERPARPYQPLEPV
jgi:MOSC domain-containing protein YiiM